MGNVTFGTFEPAEDGWLGYIHANDGSWSVYIDSDGLIFYSDPDLDDPKEITSLAFFELLFGTMEFTSEDVDAMSVRCYLRELGIKESEV